LTWLAATAGGALWLTWLAAAASRSDLPWYCVRCGEELVLERAVLYAAAAATTGTAALALAIGERGRLGGGGVASAGLVAAGSALLVVGLLASVTAGVWLVTFVGEVATILGALALAVAAAGRVLSLGPAVLLALGALGLLVLNVVEGSGPLLAAPYGAAWMWIGLTLARRSDTLLRAPR